MIDIKLDRDHDLALVNADFVLVDGAESVKQQLLIKLKLWTGEWFLDDGFGTPYLQDILGKQLTLSGVVAAIQQSILEVEGVINIERFVYEFDRQNRKLNVDFTANTNYGIVEVTI